MNQLRVQKAIRDTRILDCIRNSIGKDREIRASHSGYIWRNNQKVTYDPIFINVNDTILVNDKLFEIACGVTQEPIPRIIPENQLYYYEACTFTLIPLELEEVFKTKIDFSTETVAEWKPESSEHK